MLRGKKKLDAYIKLLEIFERELKKHHVFFSAGGYEIRYIITSKVFEEKFEVEITLYTKRYRKHHTFLNETKTYYERLKGFAYLFGFKNVQMLRSLDKIKTFNCSLPQSYFMIGVEEFCNSCESILPVKANVRKNFSSLNVLSVLTISLVSFQSW